MHLVFYLALDGGCLGNKLISRFLPHLWFNWRTFQGKLQHAGDVSEQKFKYESIRTREITDIRLLYEMYGCIDSLLSAHHSHVLEKSLFKESSIFVNF